MIEHRLTQILFVAGLSLVAASSSSSAQPKPIEPCCGVTAIDAKHGVVTAKSITGTTFNFKFDSGPVPSTLKVGQRVWARGGKVSLNGKQICCSLVTSTTLGRALIGAKIPIKFQASYASDYAAHVGECNQAAQTTFPQGGHTCLPQGTMVSSGTQPDGSDATYSWTCVCS